MTWTLTLIQILLRVRYPDVPQLSARALANLWAQGRYPILLDARRDQEYGVSHLPEARWAGRDLDLSTLAEPSDLPVVIYCSVGVRSTKMARRLRQQGIDAVNLEGSIFQWVIDQRPLDGPGGTRALVHPFNDQWARLLPPHHRASPEDIAAARARS